MLEVIFFILAKEIFYQDLWTRLDFAIYDRTDYGF